MSTSSSATYLTQLHQLLSNYFNLAEFQDLCFRMDVDHESIPGTEKSSQMREFLLSFGRNGRLPEFVTLAQTLRGHVPWPPVPENFQPLTHLTPADITADGDRNIKHLGDIINVGDISGSYAAIGAGAQIIVNQIEQALSAVDEMEKDVQASEKRLARAIQQKIEKHARLPTTVGSKEQQNPYRSLLNYRIEDAPFFYGRQEAITAMLSHLDRNRLTILQAESGSGKTSLLQAGLAARLLAAKHLPLYVRPFNEPPHKSIKRAFLPDYNTLTELSRFRDSQMSLQGFLRRVTSYLGSRKLFIFIDQFEEFFDNLTPEKEMFVSELQKCIDDPDLDVGWVLSLREEYFSKLLRMFDAVRPYENYYFLDTFQLGEAREVITQPALKFGVTYKEGLISRIIKDVAGEHDMLVPVQVQLVCSALFMERQTQPNPHQISSKLYYKERGSGDHKAPGAKGILRSHLSRTLKQQMSGQERTLAWRILYTLVSSQKHRTQRSRSAIHNELQTTGDQSVVDASSLDSILQSLENSWLIRTDDDDHDELRYELAHEYLLDEIDIDPQIQAMKLAQEILDQEVFYYREHGVLLAKDKYDLVNSQRAHLHLDDTSRELLNKSEEQQTREQTRRLRVVGIVAVFAIIIASVAVYYFIQANNAQGKAEANAREAKKNAEMAEANATELQANLLAQQAIAEEFKNPQLSLLLAIESYKLTPRSDAHRLLRQALEIHMQPIKTMLHPPADNLDMGPADIFLPLATACWSTDGKYFYTETIDELAQTFGEPVQTIQIWNVAAALSGTPLQELVLYPSQERTFEPLMIVERTDPGCFHNVVDIGSQRQPAWWHNVAHIELSPIDSHLVVHFFDETKVIVPTGDVSSSILSFSGDEHLEWSMDDSVVMSWIRPENNEYQAAVWGVGNWGNDNPLTEITSISQPQINSDGSQIAARTDENTIAVWNIASGTIHSTIPSETKSFKWIPQQNMLLLETGIFTYELWDISVIGSPLRITTIESDSEPEWSPGGEHYLTWEAFGAINLWQANAMDNDEPIINLPSQKMVNKPWNQHGSHFLTWGAEGIVQIWDVQNGHLESLPDRVQPSNISGLFPGNDSQSRTPPAANIEPRWSSSGHQVEIAHSDGSTTIWDIERDHTITLYRENAYTSWQPESPHFLSADQHGLVDLWDLRNVQSPYLQTEDTQWPVWGSIPLTSHDDPYCDYESESGSDWLCLWSADRSKYLVLNTVGDTNELEAFIVDAASGKEILRFPEIVDPLDGGWEANDSVVWLSAGPENIIYAFDSNSGKLLNNFIWDGSGFTLSQDLSQMITWNPSGIVKLYTEGNFQQPVWTYLRITQFASFNNDGSRLITMDEDGEVTIWRTEDQTPLYVIDNIPSWSGWTEDPPPIEFKSDGSEIAVMKNDGQIYVYPTDPSKWIEETCGITQRNLTWEEWRNSFPNETYYHRTCTDTDRQIPIPPSVPDGILQENSPDTLADYFASWKSVDWETAILVEESIPNELDNFLRSFIRREQIATAVSLHNYGTSLPAPASFSEETLFELCLVGSLLLEAEDVMFVCDKAVELNPEFGPYRGARGIAHLIMDKEYQQAAEDIRFFLDWKPDESVLLREEALTDNDFAFTYDLYDLLHQTIDDNWIEMLSNGNNPVNREVRFEMRDLMRFFLEFENG